MLVTFREFIVKALASPQPDDALSGGRVEGILTVIVAAAVGAWIFAHKLQVFLGLGTTSDLYQFVQLSTSWLNGKLLFDNCYGDHLSIHTYFFCPLLGILTIPLGAIGLLLALGLAAACSVVALVKILRWLGVSSSLALVYAVVAALMPLSLHVYQDRAEGFHVELLVPAMALWLTYFLLGRKWLGAMAVAIGLLAIKEDSPLIVMVVAVVVMGEDLVRTAGSPAPRNWLKSWNRPAAAVVVISAMALVLCLAFLQSQAATQYSPGSFQRLHLVGASTVNDGGSLFSFVLNHAGGWLRSPVVAQWLGVSFAATFGLIVLRPHLLVVGVVTTLIAWLMQDDLLWAPRFAHALAFFQIAGCLAFASACRMIRDFRHSGRGGKWVAATLSLVVTAGMAFGFQSQLRTAPRSAEVYRLSPVLAISPADRQKADELFGKYRREGRKEEPVIASDYLFRYAHDRNLFWYTRLAGRPKPAWILWDQQAVPLITLRSFLRTDQQADLSDYELVSQADRFLLYRLWPDRETTQAPKPTPVAGDLQGMIRLKVRIAPGHAGMSEPVLSLGPAGKGDLFFIHYVSERQLELGMECVGVSVQVGQRVEYEPGRVYELELFSGTLLRPPDSGPQNSEERRRRLPYQNLVSIRWEGREVLNTLAPPHGMRPEEVYAGYNFVRSGSATAMFTGEITEVRRGGYPATPAGGFEKFGPVRLVVKLPAPAAGLPEPLVVVGTPGDASLGYVRVLPAGKIKVGAEFWGIGAYESEPQAVDAAKPVEIIYSLPVFYPSLDDFRWGDVPRPVRESLRTRMKITVNGVAALEREVTAPIPRQPTVVFGENPVGGSWVSTAFTGSLLEVSRLPVSEP